jgi:hypothetical protein
MIEAPAATDPLLELRNNMADLEEHAFRRDKRFVVRLVLVLLAGFIGGLYLYANLTSHRTAGCAAEAVTGGGVTSKQSGEKPEQE